MIKFKTPGWQRVMQPKFTKSYCQPFKANNVFYEYDDYTRRLFEVAHTSLMSICYSGDTVINCMPEEFLYEKEIEAFSNLIADKAIARREKRKKKRERIKRAGEMNRARSAVLLGTPKKQRLCPKTQ